MTIGELFDGLVARLIANPPPGVDSAYIERFVRRNRYTLALTFAAALPPVPVVLAILQGDWRWRVPEDAIPRLRTIAERIDAHIGRSMQGFDTLARETENELHLSIGDTLRESLPPPFTSWASYDLGLRIWTFYRQRILARELP